MKTASAPAPTVLVLGGAAPRTAGYGYDISRRALEQLRGRGARVVLTDRRATLYAVPELAALVDEVAELDYADADACVAWASHYGRNHQVDAVMGFREYAVVSVAETAAALGLPGNPPAAVRRVRTKDACREWLRAAGFPQPRLLLCRYPRDAVPMLEQLGQVIVKPRARSNSDGVTLVRAQSALPGAFAEARDDDELVLVEEVVSGNEVSVEGLFLDRVPHVLGVTQKHLSTTDFRETGHTLPAPLPDDTATGAADVVRSALRSLGLHSGPFHVEAWLTSSGPVLGEVHVRQGGDWIHAALEWCRPGFELYGSWLDDLLARDPAAPPPASRGAAIRFLLAPPGRVKDVTGWRAVEEHPEVLHASCDLRAGDVVRSSGSNSDRHGAVVTGSSDATTAAALADSLLAGVGVRVDVL